jgi:hypothetical protein
MASSLIHSLAIQLIALEACWVAMVPTQDAWALFSPQEGPRAHTPGGSDPMFLGRVGVWTLSFGQVLTIGSQLKV